jgi:hypothetical protein
MVKMNLERGKGVNMHQLAIAILIIVLTLISGWGDANGFVHASSIWNEGKLIWSELLKSALSFSLGIVMYWICIRFLQEFKIVSPEIQTIGWFTVTIIGIAFFSGKFFQWQLADQIVGIAVLCGLIWLLFRTGG